MAPALAVVPAWRCGRSKARQHVEWWRTMASPASNQQQREHESCHWRDRHWALRGLNGQHVSSDAAVARAVTACLCRYFSDHGSILAAGGSITINGSGCDSESVQMDGLLVAFHDMPKRMCCVVSQSLLSFRLSPTFIISRFRVLKALKSGNEISQK